MRILSRSIAFTLLAATSVALAADPTPAPPATAAAPKATPAASPAPKKDAAPAAPKPAAPAPATAQKPAAPTAKATPPKAPRKPEDAVTPVVKNPERHADFLARIKQGEVNLLFLGDSITDGWNRRGEFSYLKFAQYKPANFGISGDRTEHVLWRITNGELDGINPKLVVLMIGTNNIGQNADEKPEWAAEGVKKIVDTIKEKLPKTKILLLAVFPRGDAGSAPRKATEAINEIIKGYADNKTVRYLDIGKVFLDDKGEIPADVMPDKLHPNPHGYDLWYDAVKGPIAEMMSGSTAAPAAGGKKKKK